jgi:hypothetical protein
MKFFQTKGSTNFSGLLSINFVDRQSNGANGFFGNKVTCRLCYNEVTLPQLINEVDKQGREICSKLMKWG